MRSASRSGLPVGSVGKASTTITRSGVLNRATPRASNHARAVSTSNVGRADDERGDPLAHEFVGIADRDRVAHVGMRFELVLDLGGRDVLAAPDDDVLQAADDREPAVVVERREVAGAEPAVGVERVGVVRGIEIADAHLGPAHAQLAVDDAQLDLADRVPVVQPRGVGRRRPTALVATVGASVDP